MYPLETPAPGVVGVFVSFRIVACTASIDLNVAATRRETEFSMFSDRI
jgi:hypothetical protein